MSACRVYLGRLSHSARERDVERFFKGYGKIREIILKDGYGFIEFDEARDADDAVYDLNGKELCGDRVIVEHAKPPGSRGGGRVSAGFGGGFERRSDRGYGGGGGFGGQYGFSRAPPMRPRNPPPLRTDYRVRIENLSTKVSWQDLKDYMRQAGEVTYADAHRIRENEGVVEFVSKSDMLAAVKKLDGTDLSGRKIKVIIDDRSSNKRSRSRSYSRDRSRSRSKNRRSRSRSKSRSKKRSASRSRSHTPASRSRSLDARQQSRSRSRSRSSHSGD